MQIKRFSEFSLNEAASAVLYHYTGVNAALSIVENDRFSCSAAAGSQSDVNRNQGKFFFLSLTRGGHGQLGYARNRGDRNLCRIEVDGQLLGSNHKVRAVDYWNRKDPADQMLAHLQPADRMHRLMSDNEMEERVLTDRPYIEHATRYIKSIDVCNEEWLRPGRVTKTEAARVQKLKGLCEQHNIKFSFYTDRAEFDIRKGGSASIPSLPDDADEGDEYQSRKSPFSAKEILSWVIVSSRDKSLAGEFFDKWKNELYPEEFLPERDKFVGDMLKQANELGGQLSYADERDKEAGLSATIHNRRGEDDPSLKDAFSRLFKEMRRRKAGTLLEFIKGLASELRNAGGWKSL